MLELLINDLKERKPFKVMIDGVDFGIYKFNPNTKKYEGVIGCIELTKMLEIIKNPKHFIKLERVIL